MDEAQMLDQVRGMDARIKKLSPGAFVAMTVWPKKFTVTIYSYSPYIDGRERETENADCLTAIREMSAKIDEMEKKVLSVEKLAQTLGVEMGG